MSLPRIPLLTAAAVAAGGAAFALVRRLRGGGAEPAPEPRATPVPQDQGAHISPQGTSAVAATPPVETPGPSVTAPAEPASETERAERADDLVPTPDPAADVTPAPVDELLAEETAKAAAEAAAIGGARPDADPDADPAMEPVYEAGGGEAEGFEQAERDLIENASHGDGGGNPLRDAFRPEVEADEAGGAVYGEADHVHVTEATDDPAADDDAPQRT